MSELKEHLFCECDECIREYRGPLSNEMRPYYLKSEADKVIAELEERVADGDKDFEMVDHQNERLLKIVRHQKYKRCLAMAEACMHKRWRTDEGFDYARSTRHMNKWLELAEKFKPNN